MNSKQFSKLKQPLLNQNGFSLVEAMIAGAAGLIVIGGLASGLTQMSSLQARTALTSRAALMQDEVADHIKVGTACSDALKDQTFPSGGSSTAEITLKNMMVDGTAMNLDHNSSLPDGLSVEHVNLIPNPTSTVTTVPLASGALLTQKTGVIHVQMARTINGVKSTSSPIDIPIKVLVDSSNKVQFCNSEAATGRVCTESGGVWDPAATDPTNACKPKTKCEFAGGYSQAPLSQGGFANEVTGAQNCPANFSAVRSGTVAAANKCGKYCIGNNFYATYTCVRCGAGMVTGTAAGMDMSAVATTADYSADANAVLGTTSQVGTLSVQTAVPTPAPVPVATATPVPTTYPREPRDPPGCFIAGTQISLPDGLTKSIEDVEVGDQILSYDESRGQVYISTVVQALHHRSRVNELYDVFTEDGHNFVSNEIHWFFVLELHNYLSAKEIYARFTANEPTTLLNEHGKATKIATMRMYQEDAPIYNLHVDGIANNKDFRGQGVGHNYFAGGILAHNLQEQKQ